MQRYTCPVCGFPDLDQPPWEPDTGVPSFDICPCCGCEFGYNDATVKAKERYRKEWIAGGAHWFEPELKPPDWDLSKQLRRIRVDLKVIIERQ